jgi:hypothetical protein
MTYESRKCKFSFMCKHKDNMSYASEKQRNSFVFKHIFIA